jgi:chromosome segregation ATPase
MKNLKLKVLSSLIVLSIIVPSTLVRADELNASTGKLKNLVENKVQVISNLEKRKEYKTLISSKKDIIKQNHETNQALRKEIVSKKEQVKALLKDMKGSKKQLNSDDLSKIEAQLTSIKTQLSSLSSTSGSIKTSFKTVKDDFKSKNYDPIEGELNNIISIQNKRTDLLKQLNNSMSSLITAIQNSTSSNTAS